MFLTSKYIQESNYFSLSAQGKFWHEPASYLTWIGVLPWLFPLLLVLPSSISSPIQMTDSSLKTVGSDHGPLLKKAMQWIPVLLRVKADVLAIFCKG